MSFRSITVVGRAAAYVHFLSTYSNAVRSGHAAPPDEINTIDPRPLGVGGSAHSDRSRSFRINMREELHNIPGALTFSHYLRSIGASPGELQPRSVLAGYLESIAQSASEHLSTAGCSLHHTIDTALRIDRCNRNYYQVQLSSGRTIVADVVILATGNEPPVVPQQLPSNAPVSCYDGGSSFARTISRRDEVVILGTGPGAIDTARYLIDDVGIETAVHMRSRNGWLSAVQSVAPLAVELVDQAGRLADELCSEPPYGLDRIVTACSAFIRKHDTAFDYAQIAGIRIHPLEQLRQDIADARGNGPAWRIALEAVGGHASRLWAGLRQEGRETLVNNDRATRLYYCKRHAMPLATAEWLEEQMSVGRITVGSSRAQYPPHSRIVVATGPEYRLTKSRNPLLQDLLARGQVRPCFAGRTDLGGLAMTNYQIEGMPLVYGMGALARGQSFAVHSFPALAAHAKAIVDQLATM